MVGVIQICRFSSTKARKMAWSVFKLYPTISVQVWDSQRSPFKEGPAIKGECQHLQGVPQLLRTTSPGILSSLRQLSSDAETGV